MSFQLLTVLVASAGLAMVGLTYNSLAAYFMFSTLVALLLVSYVCSRLPKRVLEFRREVADRVFEHEPFPVVLELTNKGRVPLFLLRVCDSLPPYLTPEESPDFILPALWSGDTAGLSYRVRGVKRGVHLVGPANVTISDPFGLFPSQVPLDTGGEAVVYPRPVPLEVEAASMGAEPRPIASGERARGSESGLEFYGIRDYQPGDELRRIHWPATAHHGQLTVIEFDQGVSENLSVVLDTRAGTEFGTGLETTLELGVRAAASLIRWTLRAEGVTLLVADSERGPQWVEADRLDREHETLELLARVEADGKMPLAKVVEWATPLLSSGAAVWVVTAAPEPSLPTVLESLRLDLMPDAVRVLILDPGSFEAKARLSDELVQDLEAIGVRTLVVRRADDLREALGSVLSTGA